MSIPRDALGLYSWFFGFSWCLTEGYMKWRSVLPYGPMRLWKDFALFALVVAALL